MDHAHWIELLGRERDGELDEGERAALEAHLESCADCRELRERERMWARALRQALEAAYPDDLEARFLARLAASPSLRARLRGWLRYGEFRLPVPAAIAAALLLVVLGIGIARLALPADPMAGVNPMVALDDAGSVEAQVRSLLVRARTLLLALDTASPDASGQFHLEAEQRLSRDLVTEVRLMQGSGEYEGRDALIDLVMDLEAILLDVSTWSGGADAQRLALVQAGITERSLLYRIDAFTEDLGGD
jgi:anti-sigma factor RsiW